MKLHISRGPDHKTHKSCFSISDMSRDFSYCFICVGAVLNDQMSSALICRQITKMCCVTRLKQTSPNKRGCLFNMKTPKRNLHVLKRPFSFACVLKLLSCQTVNLHTVQLPVNLLEVSFHRKSCLTRALFNVCSVINKF